MKIELGISTFGETTPLEATGKAISHAERIRNLVEEIEVADQVGLDIYGIGEHHRDDYAVSVPEMVLAAGAVNTKNIRLTSAVTVLSSSDPVRIYQNFATLDALSNGRAEVMAGRGSFIESFPLFGNDLSQYEELFDEKLAMLLEIDKHEKLNWTGHLTQSVDNKGVYPRSQQEHLPINIATGGNIESTIKIAQLGLPITYAIIGGNPKNFKRLIELYRSVAKEAGHDVSKLSVAAHSWGYVADTTEKALEEYYYPTKWVVDTISKDRPQWTEMTWERYAYSVGPEGAMFVGSPDVVAAKLIDMMETLQLNRFLLHLPIGSMPHEDVLHAIRLFGEQVAPIVRNYFENK